MKNGRLISVEGNQLLLHTRGFTGAERIPYTYSGQEGDVFRIAAGPDGRIYGSSILPLHFFTLDVGSKQLTDFGYLGVGEIYSLAPFEGKIYLAAYDGMNKMPLMAFDPTRSFAPGTAPAANPLLITYDGADTGWRPQSMVMGPNRKFYIGSVAGYGAVDGPLTIFDPKTHQVMKISGVVPGESVVSLAAAGGLIAGGTSIFGGGGSHTTQSEAKFFLWDPLSNRKTYETVPVPDATGITDLLTLPGGRVMGIATGIKPNIANSTPASADLKNVLFLFNLHTGKIEHTVSVPIQGLIYNSVAVGPDGMVWGLAKDGIFRFDPQTRQFQLKVRTPAPVTAGFALLNGSMYYASGPKIYRYALPACLNQPRYSSTGNVAMPNSLTPIGMEANPSP